MTKKEFIGEYMPEDNLEYFDLPQARLEFEKEFNEIIESERKDAVNKFWDRLSDAGLIIKRSEAKKLLNLTTHKG